MAQGAAYPPDEVIQDRRAGSPAHGPHGAVVAPHHAAAQAGLAVLRAEGNAVDAAIATNAALSVVAAHSCGLGGDAFWLIWPGDGGPWERTPSDGDDSGAAKRTSAADNAGDSGARPTVPERLVALNGSGRAGSLATLERFLEAGLSSMPVWSPLSITVPGAVRSWGDAHARYGSLAWADLLAPAIDLADGFPVTAGWTSAIERATATFGPDGAWAQVFRPLGRPWREGHIATLPALAATLRRLAAEGSSDFYEGDLARRQATFLAGAGALITTADLAGHSSSWERPIGHSYRGALATSHPPNSSGVIALIALSILERFPAPSGPWDADAIHLAVEASRIALQARERDLADPASMAPNAVELLLAPSHIADLARRIDRRRSGSAVRAVAPRGGGTVFLAAADQWGGVVSLIESNWHGFGSGVVDPETGIAYQDRGVSFSLDPWHPNAIAPGKRVAHTLTPGMLFRRGRPWVAHGSMGGEVQPQIYLQIVSSLVDRGIDVTEAVSLPRWGLQTRSILEPPEHLLVENRYPTAVVADLRSRGHPVQLIEAFDARVGYCHAIEILRDERGDLAGFWAATDPRSEGRPAVF